MWNVDWPLTATVIAASIFATCFWRLLLLPARQILRKLRLPWRNPRRHYRPEGIEALDKG
jgi:hypothetical protein